MLKYSKITVFIVLNTILFIHLIAWKIFKGRYILIINDAARYSLFLFVSFVCFLCISFLAKSFRYFEFLFNNHAISTTATIKVCSVLISDLELKDKKHKLNTIFFSVIVVLISTALIRFWLLIIEVEESTDLTFRFKRFGESTKTNSL